MFAPAGDQKTCTAWTMFRLRIVEMAISSGQVHHTERLA